LLEVRPSSNGAFQFSVLPQNRYQVVVTKEGYQPATLQTDRNENELVVLLDRTAQFTAAETSAAALSLADQSPAAAAQQASVYRIHLEIQPDFNAQAPRYDVARSFGKITAEPLPEQGIVRVLLGDFTDSKTANDVAAALRVQGAFSQAFVVKQGK
jgi:hypothetical protein